MFIDQKSIKSDGCGSCPQEATTAAFFSVLCFYKHLAPLEQRVSSDLSDPTISLVPVVVSPVP